MTTPIDRLAQLVAPPSQVAHQALPTTWLDVERELGLGLPSDFKELVARYGPGCFDEFIWVLQPSSSNPHLDLVRQCSIRRSALRLLVEQGEDLPFPIEDASGVIPWAVTDNGDVLYWITQTPGRPESWPIVGNEARGPVWIRYDGSATEFLADALSRRVTFEIFPEDFPSEVPTFAGVTSPA